MSVWIKADQACDEKLDTTRWKLNPRHDDFCLNPYGSDQVKFGQCALP